MCTFSTTFCHKENFHKTTHKPTSYYPAMHKSRGPDGKYVLSVCEHYIFGTTSGGKSYLPHLLRVPGTGKKGRQRACDSRKPCCLQQCLAWIRLRPHFQGEGPVFSYGHCKRRVGAGGQAEALGSGVRDRSPLGAVTGARLSETSCLPHHCREKM